MQSARKDKKKKNVFLRIACAIAAVYVLVTVFSLHLQLRDKQKTYEALQAEIQRQESINESLKEKTENSDVFLEEEARDQGYSLPGEQIYEVIPEN